MLPQVLKRTYFTCARPVMVLSGLCYRIFRAPRQGFVRVHLGPGRKSYLDGWVNVDANIFTGRADVWADLRHSLPFNTQTVDAFYSHHVIEHLPSLRHHFREVFRCLKPGGAYRVGGPNGDGAIAMFAAGRHDWFTDFPDERSSLGGKLDNFIFCRGEHLSILTESYLAELLENAGFTSPVKCVPTRTTSLPELFADCLRLEWESDFGTPHTVIVEARKPS